MTEWDENQKIKMAALDKLVAKWSEVEGEISQLEGLTASEWRSGLEAHLTNEIGERPAPESGPSVPKMAWSCLDGVYDKIGYALEQLDKAKQTFTQILGVHQAMRDMGRSYNPSEFMLLILRTGEGGPQDTGGVWGHMIAAAGHLSGAAAFCGSASSVLKAEMAKARFANLQKRIVERMQALNNLMDEMGLLFNAALQALKE
ncbi:hypothetical protein [Streptomyces sp. 1222.5]|uniref:hypothetical protein n=1 Tax=Streptomyces sp. 1222.5 TaxID=1881026 RepID=UPI003D720C85